MNIFKYRFSARLSDKQLAHIKSQASPSEFIRALIESDMRVDSHDKS